MDGDRNRTDHDRGIRSLAIASICLPFVVFPLGPVAIILNDIIGPPTSLLELLTVFGIVLPAAGGICGQIALKRTAARPEAAEKFKRLAKIGTIVGYGFLVIWVLIFVIAWFFVIPHAFTFH